MAVFRDDDLQRLDWRLLLHGPIALYYHPDVLAEDSAWLANHGYLITHFDCRTWQTHEDMHSAFAAQLAFPDYYGRNLDALNDCLSDLVIPDESGRALVFSHYDQLARQLPDVAWPVLDILATQARYFLLFGQRLIALIQSDDPQITFDPVGACPVSWNGREWLNTNRGL
jgi:RNAse (barnase) inhibitor barstar